jgi:hypothetical protein
MSAPGQARAIVARGGNVKQGLNSLPLGGKAFRMSEPPRNNLSREERLAARLRENLRRRKAQSRAMSHAADTGGGESPAETLPKPGGES